MNEKLKKILNSRSFVIILIVILICTTLLIGTYAWFTWSSPENTTLVMTIGDIADVTFETGNAISGELTPVYNYTDGLSTSFSVTNRRDTTDIATSYNIRLNVTSIDSGLNNKNAKWALVKDGVKVEGGSFVGVTGGGYLILGSSLLGGNTSNYQVYLYIDGNVSDDLTIMGNSLSGNIVVEAGTPIGVSTISQIYSPYTTATNNSLSYDLDPDNHLMMDNDGNIRYYGLATNNYINFNCSDYNNQAVGTCETWRIIGVFNNQLKIIKNESIGEFAWDTYGTNNWATASLQTYLNTTYLDSLTLDTQNLIGDGTWYIGGFNDPNSFSNVLYTSERGNTVYGSYSNTWIGKIGIMYPSDHTYNVNFKTCDVTALNYKNDEECISENWMTEIIGTTTDNWIWTISHRPAKNNMVWYIHDSSVGNSGVTNENGVIPVVYLKSSIIFQEGTTGTIDNPYKIIVQ